MEVPYLCAHRGSLPCAAAACHMPSEGAIAAAAVSQGNPDSLAQTCLRPAASSPCVEHRPAPARCAPALGGGVRKATAQRRQQRQRRAPPRRPAGLELLLLASSTVEAVHFRRPAAATHGLSAYQQQPRWAATAPRRSASPQQQPHHHPCELSSEGECASTGASPFGLAPRPADCRASGHVPALAAATSVRGAQDRALLAVGLAYVQVRSMHSAAPLVRLGAQHAHVAVAAVQPVARRVCRGMRCGLWPHAASASPAAPPPLLCVQATLPPLDALLLRSAKSFLSSMGTPHRG